jgi:hypothetical protein
MVLIHGMYDQMDSWLGNRKRIIVLNREDMISTEDRNAWATYFANQGTKVVFSNGQLGMVRWPCVVWKLTGQIYLVYPYTFIIPL